MNIVISVDVEAHRVIDEISGATNDSLGAILDILAEYGIRATFFVDIPEVHRWGREFLRATCHRLLAAGQDVQLHVHPHHASGDNSRWLLSEYTFEEQEGILSAAINDFEDLTGQKALVFRAGGFGANDATLDVLRQKGITIDSSYLWTRPGSAIRPQRSEPSAYRGVVEVPLTPAVVMGSLKRPLRCSSLDFNWLPLFIIEKLLMQMKRAGQTTAIILMHSSSMYVRVGRQRLVYRKANEARFRRLLDFAVRNGLEPRTIREVAQPRPERCEPVVLKGAFNQYVVLLYQAVIGCGISARFRLFLAVHVVFAAVVLYALTTL